MHHTSSLQPSRDYPFLNKLWEDHGKGQGSHHWEFATYLFAAVVPTAPIYSQALSHIVNFYLQDERQAQKEEIVALSKSKDKNADVKIMRYAYEALSMSFQMCRKWNLANDRVFRIESYCTQTFSLNTNTWR